MIIVFEPCKTAVFRGAGNRALIEPPLDAGWVSMMSSSEKSPYPRAPGPVEHNEFQFRASDLETEIFAEP
jgi:hypothetical protein